MKELLIQYAKYNLWANKAMIETILKLDAGFADHELVSSFPSITATIRHIWSAEYIWLQRLQLVEKPEWVQESFTGTLQEACASWQNTSTGLIHFIEKQFDDKAFGHELMYYNLKKLPVKLPVYAALMQAFNHATYHRGQLVTMLRQVGCTKIPQTDFFLFVTHK